MKLFECQNCGQPLYFENTLCESCGLRLGYLPDRQVVTLCTRPMPVHGVRWLHRGSLTVSAPMPSTMSATGWSAPSTRSAFARHAGI